MELAGETFYDRRESGLDIKIQNQQVRPTPDGYDTRAEIEGRAAMAVNPNRAPRRPRESDQDLKDVSLLLSYSDFRQRCFAFGLRIPSELASRSR